MQGTA